MLKIFVAIALLMSAPAIAADADMVVEPKIPSRFTCAIVRVLYKQYAKHYSQEEMENYLRSKGVPEIKIEGAKRCLPA